ncbi:MAG: hypothetical protein LIP05_07415 [Tannerellaceae bacterium]|nr:hypothetical protein [Tannerellaceae bacterium]
MYPSYKQAILYRQPSGGRIAISWKTDRLQPADKQPPSAGRYNIACSHTKNCLYRLSSVTIYTTIRSLTAGMGMPVPLSIAASKDTNSR